jgi:type I restriction enzyme S subunit
MKVVALGEMVDFVGGGTPSKDESLFWGGDIPWVSVKDLKSKVINETIDTITPQGVEGSSTRVIEKGALIIATRMAVGKAVILGVDAAINQDLKAVRIKGELDRDYLFFFLKQAAPYFERVSTGATVKGIKLEHLRNLEIPLPPLEEQKRIAGILDEADRVRKKTQDLIDKYDELAQSLFLDMFGDPVTNPKGWEVVQLGEMVDFVGGGTPSKDEPLFWGGDIPWVSVKDLKSKVINETIDTITPQGVEGSSTRVIEKGAIIIATRMAVGKAVILGVDAAINQDLKAVIIKGELDRDYLFYFLKQAAPYFERVSTGATVKGIKLEHLRNLEIPLPPLELQGEFSVRLGKIQACKIHLEQNDEGGNNLFNALLQKAFKGELT